MTTHVVTATREQVDWAIEMMDATEELIRESEDSGEPIEINDGAGGTFARANALLTAVSITAFGLAEKLEIAQTDLRDMNTLRQNAVDAQAAYQKENTRLREACQAAVNALRSYQYGNGSPDLAQEVADHIERKLKEP